MDRRNRLRLIAALAILVGVVLACGQGLAIFKVDVYSFIQGSGNDTIPYVIPPSSTGTASTVQKISLPPGFGSSIVQSATIDTGAANLINTAGTGTVGFQLYVAADSASTYLPASLAVDVPETAVTGPNTSPLTISGGLTPAVLAVFSGSEAWIRFVAKGTNPNVTPVTGNMALTALKLRIVVQDKIF